MKVGDRVEVMFDMLMGKEDGLEGRVGTVNRVLEDGGCYVDLDPVESDDEDNPMTLLHFEACELGIINE